MSTLYICEYSQPSTFVGNVPVGLEPGADQTVAISGSSGQSSTLKNNTTLVRLETDTICSVLFGTNPTATSGSKRLSANQTEYFGVPLNSGFKIAVISNT